MWVGEVWYGIVRFCTFKCDNCMTLISHLKNRVNPHNHPCQFRIGCGPSPSRNWLWHVLWPNKSHEQKKTKNTLEPLGKPIFTTETVVLVRAWLSILGGSTNIICILVGHDSISWMFVIYFKYFPDTSGIIYLAWQYPLDIHCHLLRRYLEPPQTDLNTPYLRRYDWMSRHMVMCCDLDLPTLRNTGILPGFRSGIPALKTCMFPHPRVLTRNLGIRIRDGPGGIGLGYFGGLGFFPYP